MLCGTLHLTRTSFDDSKLPWGSFDKLKKYMTSASMLVRILRIWPDAMLGELSTASNSFFHRALYPGEHSYISASAPTTNVGHFALLGLLGVIKISMPHAI